MENKNILIENIDRIHTTKMGIDRIKKNFKLNVDNVVEYCKKIILDDHSNIYRKGKNYYCEKNEIIITINASTYTIITAHLLKK